MQNQKHHLISSKVEPSSIFLRYFFFISGIVATIAYRIIFLLNPFWVKVAWYVGTIGFIFYFGHRASIESKRAKLVKEYDLVNEIEKSNVAEDKKPALAYLTETTLTSKSRYNSAFIFIVSLIVLIMGTIMDLYPLFK